jgi:pimeloyl-ACP methyl ester carboxylesterase
MRAFEGEASRVTVQYADNGRVTIAYEMVHDNGDPLLLIMGMAAQMISWPQGFIQALIDEGFAVARFDNRDSGLSTHLDGVRPPTPLASFFRRRKVPYRLEDMAGDGAAVLDALGWDKANIVGISLGAAVGQVMAARESGRVQTLTSIATAPPSLRLSRIPMKSTRFLVREARRGAPKSRAEAEDRAVVIARFLNPHDEIDEASVREIAGEEYERSSDPDGVRRQGATIVASWNRLRTIKGIRTPTLIVHGDSDPIASLKGSRAAAKVIANARLMVIPGMGHALPERVWAELARAIRSLAH